MISELSNPAVGTPVPFRSSSAPLRKIRWAAMGTQCEIQYSGGEAEAAISFERDAVEWVGVFEARYSRFRANSLVSRINQAAGREWVEVDAEMERLLDLCTTLYFLSKGVLDPTALPLMRLWDFKAPRPRVPSREEIAAARALVGWSKVQRRPGAIFLPQEGMALDFGGWGKEYAVDAVAQLAQLHGISDVLVDFGHDLRALGAPPGRAAWHIGLEDPTRAGVARGSIAVKGQGVASSGDYLRNFVHAGRRYGHIIDPRTGWPVANGCTQATVIASNCLQAGLLSTAAFILGPKEGIDLIQNTYGAEGQILTDTARHQTRKFFTYVVDY